MNNVEIALRRLHAQGLRTPFAEQPENVVQELGVVQAQEFAYAKWSVAQRTARASRADVDRALAEGRILRTHILRPTWHFVAARDIHWLMTLSGPRVHALNRHYYGRLGLDGVLLARAQKVLTKAVAGGMHRTRGELEERLRRAGIEATGPRLAYIVMHAELEAVICSGLMRGKQHTYALLEERAPDALRLSRENALAALTRRYFSTRGPATMKDFAGWSSLTMADAKHGLSMVERELEYASVEGRMYWFAPGSAPPAATTPIVDLLQAYDEYGMSYSESRDVLREPGLEMPSGSMPMHLIMLNGRLVGRWRHVEKKDEIEVETRLHRPLRRGEAHALDIAIDRYRAFAER